MYYFLIEPGYDSWSTVSARAAARGHSTYTPAKVHPQALQVDQAAQQPTQPDQATRQPSDRVGGNKNASARTLYNDQPS